jgi:hypothetical protein
LVAHLHVSHIAVTRTCTVFGGVRSVCFASAAAIRSAGCATIQQSRRFAILIGVTVTVAFVATLASIVKKKKNRFIIFWFLNCFYFL